MDNKKQIDELAKLLTDRIVDKTWRPHVVAKEIYDMVSKEAYERGKRDAAYKIFGDIVVEYPILPIVGNCTLRYCDLKESVKQCGAEIKEE